MGVPNNVREQPSKKLAPVSRSSPRGRLSTWRGRLGVLSKCHLSRDRRLPPLDGNRVKVKCACGREVLLALEAFAGLPSNPRIVDLQRRLRCDTCGEKGRMMV